VQSASLPATVVNVSFSPNGSKIAAVLEDGHIALFDVSNGRLLSSFFANEPVRQAVISPDGSLVLSRSSSGNLFL